MTLWRGLREREENACIHVLVVGSGLLLQSSCIKYDVIKEGWIVMDRCSTSQFVEKNRKAIGNRQNSHMSRTCKQITNIRMA